MSEYSGEHDIDAPYPLKYECITLHVSLEALEDLCDPRFVPGSKAFIEHARSLEPPFKTVSYIRSTRQLGAISLDDYAGNPYVTIVRYPNDILIHPLNGGPTSAINLKPYPEFAAYVSFFLPAQAVQSVSHYDHVAALYQSNASAPATTTDSCRA